MESWRKVWRDGFVPQLSLKGLEALREALEKDDERLVQGLTILPPPTLRVMDLPVESACAIGYCGWKGEGLKTVGECEEFFAFSCLSCDNNTGEPANCRYFLSWFDETPRDEMRAALLSEVEAAIAKKTSSGEVSA